MLAVGGMSTSERVGWLTGVFCVCVCVSVCVSVCVYVCVLWELQDVSEEGATLWFDDEKGALAETRAKWGEGEKRKEKKEKTRKHKSE